MANVGGVCVSFKAEVLQAQHNLLTHSLKLALYQTSGSLGPTVTTAYSTTNEVATQAGVYAAGGKAVSNPSVVDKSGNTAYWTPAAAITWGPGFSADTDAALLYNTSTSPSGKAIAVYAYLRQQISNGSFMLSMPTHAVGSALLNVN